MYDVKQISGLIYMSDRFVWYQITWSIFDLSEFAPFNITIFREGGDCNGLIKKNLSEFGLYTNQFKKNPIRMLVMDKG